MSVDRRTWLKLAAAGSAGLGAAALAPAPAGAVKIEKAGAAGRNYAGALDQLRLYIDQHLKAYGLPGMTVSLVDRDGFQATVTAGYADVAARTPVAPQHLFQIGSISKSFCAIAILQCVDQKRLTLDDSIAALLPGVALPGEIKVRHLLAHTAGIPDNAPMFPRGWDGLWSVGTLGARHQYSNTGYQMLGEIVQRVQGRPYREVVGEQILQPLGMSATIPLIRIGDRPAYAVGYQPYYFERPFPRGGRLEPAPWLDFTNAAGSIASTPHDMALYLRWLMAAGKGEGAPLLSRESAALFVKPAVEAPDWGEGARYAAGLAVMKIDGGDWLHHTGGMLAFSSSLHVDPESGVGAFASTNANVRSYRPRAVTIYACRLLKALRGGAAAEVPPIPSATTFDKPADYLGAYRAADGEAFDLAADGDGVMIRFAGEARRLEPQGEDSALAPLPRFSRFAFAFERRGGQVAGAWWGPKFYGRNGVSPATGPVPAEIAALEGYYVNDDPWQGASRIVARPDGLYADGVARLTLTSEGWWRGEEGSTERLRFDAFLGGRPQRMNYSGVDFLRRPDET